MICKKCHLDLPLYKFSYIQAKGFHKPECRECVAKPAKKGKSERQILASYFSCENKKMTRRAYMASFNCRT